MFNFDVTSMFSGAFPGTIQISSTMYTAAVDFYVYRLRAKVTARTSRYTVLQSAYGFNIRVERVSSSRVQSSVRLSLNQSYNRSKIARGLGNGARVKTSRSGLEVVDPYHVKWTIV
eukprot:IDg2714t1